jgi:hypothetical protein
MNLCRKFEERTSASLAPSFTVDLMGYRFRGRLGEGYRFSYVAI